MHIEYAYWWAANKVQEDCKGNQKIRKGTTKRTAIRSFAKAHQERPGKVKDQNEAFPDALITF